jgi:hypothetical protein
MGIFEHFEHLKLIKICWKLDFTVLHQLETTTINSQFLVGFKDPANQKIEFLCLLPDWLNFLLLIN